MREILFRGKRADNGEWETGGIIMRRLGTSEETVYIADAMTGYPAPVDTETVGQYTGIKDVNGTKVFEGDIVACEDGDGGYEYQDLIMRNGLICWGETGWYISNRQSITLDDMYIKNGKCDEIEVIGNIHDNPELLKGEN